WLPWAARSTPRSLSASTSRCASMWPRWGNGSARCAKGEDGLRQQLVLFHAYHHCCLPHASLRVPLAAPLPTNGTGSATQWQPRTPAMAAGLTDHVWTLREVLLFRVPLWPQPAGV